ncbi:MAG: XdhC family protein [Blastocatellia bacterium]|nr:XdhC family protein [Blastocatellia bacterium]
MKEVREILERVSAFGPNERAILATVVDVRGSGYRLPGARMLMLENGDTFGMVSGGCLEADVLVRARNVLQSGRSEVFTYDTTDDENSVFSLNMGCRGVVRLLLESVGRESILLTNLQGTRDDRVIRTVATLISSDTSADTMLGGRLYYSGEDLFVVDRLPTFLENSQFLHNECARFHEADSNYGFHTFETAEGAFEFGLESIKPPVSLLLFGAGADAIPLAQIAADLGWQVAVFDHRPAFLTSERFASARRLVLYDRDKPIESVAGDSSTVAVMMTHNYQHDGRILPHLLRSKVAYVAALGPKRRTEQLLGEVTSNGDSFTDEQLARLYAPAGLDIGADTPEAIALSIVAEIQSVLKSRDGGHLRNRMGSIYDRK